MNVLRKIFIAAWVMLLAVSCARETLAPEQRILGEFVLDDGSGLADGYLSFQKGGRMIGYKSSGLDYTFAENSFWHCSDTDFEENSTASYYIQDGVLYLNDQTYSSIELNDGVLTIGERKYSQLKSFKSEYYSSIKVQENPVVIPYESRETKVPIIISNPIQAGALSIKDINQTWLSNVRIENDTLKFVASETKTDRDGEITLGYTNAGDYKLQINQRPSTYIKLAATSGETDYKAKEVSFACSIENPIATSQLKVECYSSWVTDIKTSDTAVTFNVSENATTSGRITTFFLSYVGAADVEYTFTQKSTTTTIKTAEESRTVDYKGGAQSVGYTIENPHEGASLNASTTQDWITDINVADDIITFNIPENNTGASRSGKITLKYGSFATKDFIVEQSWSDVEITTTPTYQSVDYKGGSNIFSCLVTNPHSGTSLTASTSNDWITNVKLTDGTVSYTVSENNTGSSRSGKITLKYGSFATKDFVIEQTWSAVELTLTPTSQAVDYKGGSKSISCSITNPRLGVDLTASTSNDWITNVKLTDGMVSYTVAENNTGSSRSGKITLKYGSFVTKDFNVEQSWSAVELTLTPTSQSVDYKGGSKSISYTITNPRSGATLTATTSNDWITNLNVSDNAVTYSVSENKSILPRSGNITVKYGTFGTEDFTVEQSAMPVQSITLGATALSIKVDESSSIGATVVPGDASLTWSSSDNNVATVDNNGKVTAVGGGTATITASSGGKTVSCTVTVARLTPTFSISSNTLSCCTGFSEGITITSNSDCTFTASSDNTSVAGVSVNGKVVTITCKASGSANITVNCPQTSRYSAATSQYCTVVVLTDLSSAGTANCYIVNKSGNYKFKATVKGSSTESVGTPTQAVVLWESFGTNTAPSVGDLVNAADYYDGYVTFKATSNKGNAVQYYQFLNRYLTFLS